jgi:transposase
MVTKTKPIRPPPPPGLFGVPGCGSRNAWEPVPHKTSQKSESPKPSSKRLVRDIRRATRKQYSAEEKIRIVLDGLRGEHSLAELCRREGIAESLYYSWSKEFLEAGKRRLAGDTARAATSDEVKDLRREARELKEVVAEQALELRLLKKSLIADGGGEE